jgi:sec-independent protein translocase protein TatB
MLDMSWGEIMVIGGVALIVIGPKDLPKALRTLGQMTTKMRRMAGEFQSQFNDAMREAELDEVRKEVEALNRQVATSTATAFNPIQTIRDELRGAVEAPVLPPVTAGPAASPPAVAEISSPETAIATAAANSAADHAAQAATEAAAEEMGAPPAIAADLPPEPHASAAPEMPLDLTGPGLEPGEEPAGPPARARHGAAAPHGEPA